MLDPLCKVCKSSSTAAFTAATFKSDAAVGECGPDQGSSLI